MLKLTGEKGKGRYEIYKSTNRKDHNKEARTKRRESRLAKRKEWRIKKYKGKIRKEISGTTDKLFYRWGISVGGRK